MKDDKPLRKQVGDYMIDISKLTFGGIVLSVILEISHDKVWMLIAGFIATAGIALWGFYLSNKKG